MKQIVRTCRETALRIEQEADGKKWSLWCGRRVRVADGSGISMPDTPENQKSYPQPKGQKPGCGCPVMRVVALFSLATGVMLDSAKGALGIHERNLMRSLWHLLEPEDVLLNDRGFCSYADLHLLAERRVDTVTRKHLRRGESTVLQRFGKKDHLVQWLKTDQRPKWLSREKCRSIPKTMVVRQIEIIVERPGFRTKNLSVVTTLLDPKRYPAEAIAQLYLRRWRAELFLRDIKITMGMDILRCKTPEMLEKELCMRNIAYNLIRAVMLEASTTHRVRLDRLSFKGTLATVRQWAPVLATPAQMEPAIAVLLYWQYIYERDYEGALTQISERLPVEITGLATDVIPRELLAGYAYQLLGNSEKARASYESARGVMERLVQERPEDGAVHSALGLICAGLGKKEDRRMAKGKILVADDEKHIVSILKSGFRSEGYEVVTAEDGEQAVEQVRSERPDIVVMDVMMPRMDGYEACRMIKSDPETHGVRVIMLTAKGRMGDAQRGLDAGADLYVTKPFSLPQLIEFIHSIVK